jgi:type IV secretion system protein VirB11
MNTVSSEQLLAPLNPWLKDPQVSEIMMNRPGEIYVEKLGKVYKQGVIGLHAMHVMRALQLIANENDKIFDTHVPLLSAQLYDQSRIQAVLPPVSRTVCFSIRKHSQQIRAWDSLMTPAYFQLGHDQPASTEDALSALLQKEAWPSFLRAALLSRKTLLIAGETGSGKTTLLGVLLATIRKNERVIVLEDTPELPLCRHNNLSLLARDDDFLAKPVTLADLLRASLRLRPDRLVLGELRAHEAYDFISACQTGHGGSMATIHAATPQMALERLTQLYLLRSGSTFPLSLLRELIANTIDVVVQLSRRSGTPAITAIYYQGAMYE